MKKYVYLILIAMMVAISCKKSEDNSLAKILPLLMTSRPIIMTTLDLDKVGNAITPKNGTAVKKSVISSAFNASVPMKAETTSTNEVIYLTGQKGTTPMMLELTLDSTSALIQVRTVLFNISNGYSISNGLSNRPWSAYPSVFTLEDGYTYMLFSQVGTGQFTGTSTKFKLFKYETEDSQSVTFTETDMWDFSVLEADIQARSQVFIDAYNTANPTATQLTVANGIGAWVPCPDYNPVTQTMYFGLFTRHQFNDNVSDDGVDKSVLAYSKLVGNQFTSITTITGEANPYDKRYYLEADGITPASSDKTVEDFIERNKVTETAYITQAWHKKVDDRYSIAYHNGGLAQYSRIYTTRNSTGTSVKAYFTDLYISFPHYAGQNTHTQVHLNSTDPADWATIDHEFYVTGTILSTETRMVIGDLLLDTATKLDIQYNDVFSADIDKTTGVSSNLENISSKLLANKAGLNYISGISEDGSTIYVAHMDQYLKDDGFWAINEITGVVCTLSDNYSISYWNGEIQIYKTLDSGVTYTKVATIQKTDVTIE